MRVSWEQFGIETVSVGLSLVALFVVLCVTFVGLGHIRPEQPSIAQPSQAHQSSKTQLKADALFGAYQTQSLQETRLNMKLTGVFATLDPSAGSAVITSNGQKPKLYAVGDTLSGNVKVKEVFSTHIVLEQAGEQIILSLPQKTL